MKGYIFCRECKAYVEIESILFEGNDGKEISPLFLEVKFTLNCGHKHTKDCILPSWLSLP